MSMYERGHILAEKFTIFIENNSTFLCLLPTAGGEGIMSSDRLSGRPSVRCWKLQLWLG